MAQQCKPGRGRSLHSKGAGVPRLARRGQRRPSTVLCPREGAGGIAKGRARFGAGGCRRGESDGGNNTAPHDERPTARVSTACPMGLPKRVTSSTNLTSSPRRRGPSGVRQKTLDSRLRGNDEIENPGVTLFRNAPWVS